MSQTGSMLTMQQARNLVANKFLVERGGGRGTVFGNDVDRKYKTAVEDFPATMAIATAEFVALQSTVAGAAITPTGFDNKNMNDFPSGFAGS